MVSDTTAWNGSGLGFTQLFGLDQTASANRATNLSVRQALLQQPSLLPNAALNLSAGAGATALSSGDTRGSDALAQAGSTIRSFQAAGGAPSTLVSLSDYSASFSSRIGSTAAAAATNQTNADAQATEAQSRRSGVEGVNLDQELISLTTYQQAYNASARLLTAAKDMYDTLLQLVP